MDLARPVQYEPHTRNAFDYDAPAALRADSYPRVYPVAKEARTNEGSFFEVSV